MKAEMLLHVAGNGEFFATPKADMRLHTRVNLDVDIQVGLLAEGLAALAARVRPQAEVGVEVVGERAARGELFLAAVALVDHLLAQVAPTQPRDGVADRGSGSWVDSCAATAAASSDSVGGLKAVRDLEDGEAGAGQQELCAQQPEHVQHQSHLFSTDLKL